MEKQIRYCTEYSDQIVQLLKRFQVKYSRREQPLEQSKNDWLIYTVRERDPGFAQLLKALNARSHISVLESVHYSEKERMDAEWLTIRAIVGKVELRREKETFVCSEYYEDGNKAYHRSLSGEPFYVAGPVRHSRQQNFFYSYEASDYHVFCTEQAKRALESAGAEIQFEEVLLDSTGAPIIDLYYMAFQNPLPTEAVLPDNCPEQYICPCCGRTIYFPPMYPLKIRRGDFAGCRTACKTAEMFSFGGNITFSLPMISQALYRVLKENALLRGLDISPVEIVE